MIKMRLKEIYPVYIVTDFVASVIEQVKDEDGNVVHTFYEPSTIIEKYVQIGDGKICLVSSMEDADCFDQESAHEVVALVQQKTGIERWYYQRVLDEPMYMKTEESVTEFGVFDVK